MQTITSVNIQHRFAGPPFGANGGYTAGLLAEHAGIREAHVTLSAPVPMGRGLEITTDGGTARISHGGRVLASAAPVSMLDWSHPTVDFVSAVIAAGDVDPAGHPFPGCFVCGPHAADGMHLLPGPVGDGVVAVPWRPTVRQADPTGTVPLRMVAAALDCPSVFPALAPGELALLASMTFGVARLPSVADHLVVTGWARSVEDRKLRTSSAIATADGETVAKADTLWVKVDAARLTMMAEQAA